MPNTFEEANQGLSSLWDRLSDYPRIWFHRTSNFGYTLVHVLDHEGREIARRIHSTGHWEWRVRSPERWFPLPEEAITVEFQGDETFDCVILDSLDTTIPGGFREISA